MYKAQARIQKFFKGGGEEEKLDRKMFVDTRINACNIKARQTCSTFSLLPFKEDCLLFFALFSYYDLFLKFERGVGLQPRNPPPPTPFLDPPMQ